MSAELGLIHRFPLTLLPKESVVSKLAFNLFSNLEVNLKSLAFEEYSSLPFIYSS